VSKTKGSKHHLPSHIAHQQKLCPSASPTAVQIQYKHLNIINRLASIPNHILLLRLQAYP
jgi:hypothetical protein